MTLKSTDLLSICSFNSLSRHLSPSDQNPEPQILGIYSWHSCCQSLRTARISAMQRNSNMSRFSHKAARVEPLHLPGNLQPESGSSAAPGGGDGGRAGARGAARERQCGAGSGRGEGGGAAGAAEGGEPRHGRLQGSYPRSPETRCCNGCQGCAANRGQ